MKLRNDERVTFVITLVNTAAALARIVMLFHRLNVDIDAIWMVRRRKSESMRIHVTVQASRDHAARLEAQIAKIVSVTSVGIEHGAQRRVDDERRS